MEVSQTGVLGVPLQGASVSKHWTHWPELLQTWPPPELQAVPPGAFVNCGVMPLHAPVWQAEVGTGTWVGSATVIVPPAPLHTAFWHMCGGGCAEGGATVLPRYMHAPDVSQSAHAGTDAGHATLATQQ
jgi:hypothetical protein